MTVDARFFLAALEGLSDADVERSVLPFPSHEVDPYRGLKPHFDIASARARALHGMASGTARLLVVSAAALLPRLTPPARLMRTAVTLDARSGDRSDRACRAPRRGRVHPPGSGRRVRRVLRPRWCGGLLPRRRRRAHSSRVRRRHDRVDPRLRPGNAALERRARSGGDRAAAGTARRCGPTGSDARRSSITSPRVRPIVFVSEPDEVDAQGRKLWEQVQGSYDEAMQKGQRVAAAGRPAGRLGHGGRMARRRDGARDACADRRRAGDHPHRLSAGGRVLRPPEGLGRRDPPRPRARRHAGLRRALGRTRRADD